MNAEKITPIRGFNPMTCPVVELIDTARIHSVWHLPGGPLPDTLTVHPSRHHQDIADAVKERESEILDLLRTNRPSMPEPPDDGMPPRIETDPATTAEQVQTMRDAIGTLRKSIALVADESTPDHGTIGIVPALAEAIMDTDSFATDAGGKLYVYSAGAYRPNGATHVATRTRELLDTWGESKKWSTHRAKETAAYIATTAPALWERPPRDRINVKNGLLDISDPGHPHLLEHSPEYLSIVQLPVTFDPDATCPAWETFVSETFPADAHDLAWEMPADLMQPDRSDQRAILLMGEGSNGKSTYLRGVRAFIGKRNVAGMSLQKMENDRFAVAGLLGKLANICADLPSSHLESTSIFKAVTGGDALHGEYKHFDAFDFEPFARLIFSANHYPRSSDSSHAFFRRWAILPFERTFEGSAAIAADVLDARLAQPRELSGVLNKAIAALPRLRRQGFTVSPSMQSAWEEFRGTTDPLAVWLDHATESDPDGYVPRAVLRKAYADHCRDAGHPIISETAFGNAIRRLRPTLTFGERTVDGKKGVRCYLGIVLNIDSGPPKTPAKPPKQPPHGTQGTQGLLNCRNNSGTDVLKGGEEENISAIKGNPAYPAYPVSEKNAAVPHDDEEIAWTWIGDVKAERCFEMPPTVLLAAGRLGCGLDTFASVEDEAARLAEYLDKRAVPTGTGDIPQTDSEEAR